MSGENEFSFDSMNSWVGKQLETAKQAAAEAVKPFPTQPTPLKAADVHKIDQSGQFSDNPVRSILVFPEKNNRTYRSGFVKLMAFSNDIALERLVSDSDKIFEAKRHTKPHKKFKTFTEDNPLDYLANAKQNLKKTRKATGAKIIFSAILPLPLSIKEEIPVEWASEPSGMNKGIVGGAYEAKSSMTQYLVKNNPAIRGMVESADSAISWAGNQIGNRASEALGQIVGSFSIGDSIDASTLGTNAWTDKITGVNTHAAAVGSIAGSIASNPSASMVSIGANPMSYVNEGLALNGRRQIINDQGYWAKFQGVQPRSFNLTWSIIPENHDDALNGLMLCARLKEFSLPESVSTVDQLAPCYWNVEFSNPLIDYELLYGDLVITQISLNFAEQGEFHLSGTPKKFDISITFQEARAPNSDIFKIQEEGSNDFATTLRTAPSRAIATLGDKISGGIGSSGLGDVLGGGFGGLGGMLDGALGKLGDIKNTALGKIADVAGGALDGIIGGVSGGAGDLVSGIFGDYAGNLVKDTISNAAASASGVLVNAIATGDFDNLGDKMKDAAMAGAVGTVVDAAGELIGDVVSDISDYAFDKIGMATDSITDWLGVTVGVTSQEEADAREEARTKNSEAKESAEKAKELKEKLAKIEANDNISAADKKAAREKVEAEMKKANEAQKAAQAAKEKAESIRKAEEAKKEAEKKAAQKAKDDKEAEEALKEILGK